MNAHIINCLVENHAGVLARIVGLISGRGYNIQTLNVGPTNDPSVSQLTMVVPGDDRVIDQVIQQLRKQIDVISVTDMSTCRHIARELILVRIEAKTQKTRTEIVDIVALFTARVIAVTSTGLTVQMVGDSDTVADFLNLLSDYTISTLSRTGLIAVEKASAATPAQKKRK